MNGEDGAADLEGSAGPGGQEGHKSGPSDRVDARLTAQHLLMLQLLARGYAVGRSAAVLVCASREVEALIAEATVCLGARDRLEAVALAKQRRLIL
ncbi:MAG TPA: hypothetical protein VGW38_25870 [Chloroflexota bacterium]|nr:hypothetical protein [Chloroflexota bacterium]